MKGSLVYLGLVAPGVVAHVVDDGRLLHPLPQEGFKPGLDAPERL